MDIVIVSTNLTQYIEELKIDNKLEWTPYRAVKGKLKYPDHYGLLLSFKGLPSKETKSFPGRKSVIWNTRKRGGWDVYKQRTENNERLYKVVESNEEDPEKVLKCIEKELTSVKFASFGKVKHSSKSKEQKKLDTLQTEKIKVSDEEQVNKNEIIESIDKEMTSVLKSIENKKFEKDINQLESIKKSKGRAAATFSLKKMIVGKKKILRIK